MKLKQLKIHFFYITLIFIICTGVFFLPKETPNLFTRVFFLAKKTPDHLENNSKEIFDLSTHWSQGNIVALIRHVERCDQSNNQCLDGNTGITEPGKTVAIKMGKDFKTLLPLNNATIYNSPAKRTAQTAKLMFGSTSIDQDWLQEDCKKDLLKDIFNYKENGRNLILITHSTCISLLHDAKGNKLINMSVRNKKTFGVTFFLTVNKDTEQAYVLGYLYPNDWINLLGKSSYSNLLGE